MSKAFGSGEVTVPLTLFVQAIPLSRGSCPSYGIPFDTCFTSIFSFTISLCFIFRALNEVDSKSMGQQ